MVNYVCFFVYTRTFKNYIIRHKFTKNIDKCNHSDRKKSHFMQKTSTFPVELAMSWFDILAEISRFCLLFDFRQTRQNRLKSSEWHFCTLSRFDALKSSLCCNTGSYVL